MRFRECWNMIGLTRFKQGFRLIAPLHLSTVKYASTVPNVCVVGSGPAGFYCVQGLLRMLPGCHVDIFEKLPVPFGLIRYGVAPDHQDAKNVVKTFTAIAQNYNVGFYGNVVVGKDVLVSELLAAYHAVILCTGADESKSLGIPGESLDNVLSAREFVGWYNGFPEDSKANINLDTTTAVILGHGNVALDIGRILLKSVDELKGTDITDHALETLTHSRIKKVFLVGRRGLLQAAFTIKEIRELMKLKECKGIIRQEDLCTINKDLIKALPRPRQRLAELIMKYSSDQHFSQREWELVFYRSPLEFLSATKQSNTLVGVCLAVNEFQDTRASAVATRFEKEVLDCGLVIKSIGYRSRPLEKSIPFDHTKGIINNEDGRVKGIKGLYCCGWVASGPFGVILTTVDNSFQMSRIVAQDIASGNLVTGQNKHGAVDIIKLLRVKGIQVVTFKDWETIDAEEQRRGAKVGKLREKILHVKEMLQIIQRT